MGMLSMLKSRKFWATICALALPALNAKLGVNLDPEVVIAMMLSISVFVFSVAKEDAAEKSNKKDE